MGAFYLRREVALVLGLMWVLDGDSAAERPLTPGIVAAAIQGLLHYGRRNARPDAVDPDVLAQGQFDAVSGCAVNTKALEIGLFKFHGPYRLEYGQ